MTALSMLSGASPTGQRELRQQSYPDFNVECTKAAENEVHRRPVAVHWGSNSVLLNRAMMLRQGDRLDGRRGQLDAAQSALDDVLGRNAVGISMVTGFGTRSPMHPRHRPSAADGVPAPVPGFLVGGPNAGQQDATGCPPYPSKLPALSRLDQVCSDAGNEVAIDGNAPPVDLSAALQVLTGAPR